MSATQTQIMLESILRSAKIHIDSRLANVPQSQFSQMMNRQPQPIFIYFERGTTKFFPQYQRSTPWGGFLNIRLNQVEIFRMSQANLGQPPFVVIDTDYVSFGGSPHDIHFMRAVYNGPIVARDFYMTHRQVDEVRALGGDAMIFSLSLSPTVNVHSLHKHCKNMGMKPFFQVSSNEDIKEVPDDESIVFVSCADLRKEEKPSFQRALGLADKLGDERCFIVDTPNTFEEIALSSVQRKLLGIAYPNEIWSGENVYHKVNLLKQQRTKDLNEFLGLDALNESSPYMLSIELFQRPQPVQIIYNSPGEAEKARNIVNNAWSNSNRGMMGDGLGIKGEPARKLLDIPIGINESQETIDPSDISRVTIMPVQKI